MAPHLKLYRRAQSSSQLKWVVPMDRLRRPLNSKLAWKGLSLDNPLAIRAATTEDLPRIVQMKLEMFCEAGHEGLLDRDASNLVLVDYCHLYELGLAKHFVACSEDVVAMSGAFLKSDIPFRYFESSTYGFVGDVYTDRAFRRRKLA